MSEKNFNESDCMIIESSQESEVPGKNINDSDCVIIEASKEESCIIVDCEEGELLDSDEEEAGKVEVLQPAEAPECGIKTEKVSAEAHALLTNKKEETAAEKEPMKLDEEGIIKQIPLPATKVCVETPKQQIFELKFSNAQAYEQFGAQILQALQNVGETTKQLTVELSSDAKESNGGTPTIKAYQVKASTRESSPDYTGLAELFMVDVEPVEKINPKDVPSYKRSLKRTLGDEPPSKKLKEDLPLRAKRPGMKCFNCDSEEHSIRECRKPRNNRRIMRNKNQFSKKNERYHTDLDQRFAHVQPGSISEKLRRAMRLGSNELPFYFYRMRVLGYPPAWLMDAKITSSGLAVINMEDQIISTSESLNSEQGDKYDANKIHSFPGFNVPLDRRVIDDYRYQRVPKYSKHQSKQEFIKSLGARAAEPYRRQAPIIDTPKKVAEVEAAQKPNTTALEISDMDIDDGAVDESGEVVFSRPPPPSEEPKAPTPPPPPAATGADPTERAVESPSLAFLEAKKKKLLRKLQSDASPPRDTNAEDSLIDDVLAMHDSVLDQTLTTAAAETGKADTDSQTASASEFSKDLIKESHAGTPVLKFSEFDQLPKGDNFKVGVSDVIAFENLPDSTGAYEHLKKVLKKVRQKLNKQ